jgi:transposase
MPDVIIGMDPHKHSATIEIIDTRERVLEHGRFATTTTGYRAMLAAGRRYPRRRWAIEGCNGIGRHIAQRLIADGETVLDVPAKLSVRMRVFDTGQGRKTDPVDAHSVAVAGLRSPALRTVAADDATVALRLLVDRRDELGRARTETISRIHHLLLELIPGGAKKFLTRGQASYLLRTAPAPIGVVAQTHQQLARELIDELTVIDAKIRAADKQLRQLVTAAGSCLVQLNGIGPSRAARLIGDIADIGRFRTAAHLASWNGTAPIEASSGDQKRHRLSRAGNRRINRVLHIMAVVQLRHDTPGRAYYRRRLAEGKTTMEALRALKRHLEPPRRFRGLHRLGRMESWEIVGGSTRPSCGSGRCVWWPSRRPSTTRSGRRSRRSRPSSGSAAPRRCASGCASPRSTPGRGPG